MITIRDSRVILYRHLNYSYVRAFNIYIFVLVNTGGVDQCEHDQQYACLYSTNHVQLNFLFVIELNIEQTVFKHEHYEI